MPDSDRRAEIQMNNHGTQNTSNQTPENERKFRERLTPTFSRFSQSTTAPRPIEREKRRRPTQKRASSPMKMSFDSRRRTARLYFERPTIKGKTTGLQSQPEKPSLHLWERLSNTIGSWKSLIQTIFFHYA
jgi:hypothetical protein